MLKPEHYQMVRNLVRQLVEAHPGVMTADLVGHVLVGSKLSALRVRKLDRSAFYGVLSARAFRPDDIEEVARDLVDQGVVAERPILWPADAAPPLPVKVKGAKRRGV